MIQCDLPSSYKDFLEDIEVEFTHEDILFYGKGTIIERNETLEVTKYAPGYIAIGDDSGGRAIILSLINESVSFVSQGSMNPEFREDISASFHTWKKEGFIIPEDEDYD